MQSHTFSRARGVPLMLNGSVSQHQLRTQQPCTSRSMPRSESLAARPRQSSQPHDPSLPPTFVSRFHDEAAVRRMIYRRLGHTDMVVSKIGFGCASLGGMFGNIEDSMTEMVETAIRKGINLIDTGYWYGQSRSEAILGKILTRIPRRCYYIATKVGRFELDYARTFDFRADKILESLTNSLKQLRLTYVDICFVQLHDADFAPNQSIVLYETLQALEIAKKSGKIRYVGLTGYPLDKIVSVIECSTVKIDVVMSYCHGSLNDNSLVQYIQVFQARGVAVLNSSPLSMGLLSEMGPPSWHPAGDIIKETCLAATHYCLSKNVSIAKLAMDYAVNLPGCSSCIVGSQSIKHLIENIEIALGHLSDFEQRVRDRIMRRYFDRLENSGWQGVDVAEYWKRLRKLGLPALSTHRHSSVESLASTLNGLTLSMHSSPSSSEMRSMKKRHS